MSSEKHNPVTRTAIFRFYAELNDFLPVELRQKPFSYPYRGKPAIKDIIQAIGVPHSEIDLILIDGRSVGFGHRLAGSENVSVYPVFESLDISPLIHLRPKPLRQSRFILDVNLGKLARKLRLLGFDTLFKNNFHDAEIIRISEQEKRIILTRDIGILKNKRVTHGLWIREQNPGKQLKEVVKRLQLQNECKPLTRCSVCNGLLQEISRENIKERIPDDTYQHFDSYKECSGCRKIYWPGSHFDKIKHMIDQLQKSI